MRRAISVIFVVAAVAFFFALCFECSAAHAAGSKEAVEAAKSKGMPVFVDVGSTHCIPCKKMVPVLEGLTKRYKGRLEVIFVDFDKEKKFARELGATMIPTQIIYDKAGREVRRHVGYISLEDCEKLLKESGI